MFVKNFVKHSSGVLTRNQRWSSPRLKPPEGARGPPTSWDPLPGEASWGAQGYPQEGGYGGDLVEGKGVIW